MPSHNRPKDGIALLDYVAGIPRLASLNNKGVDGRNKSGHDDAVSYYQMPQPVTP